jgi:polar amino acid transport system ATP-binding protein
VSEPIVSLSAVSKDYRGLRPLRVEQLELGRAERVALVGLDPVAAEVLANLITGATLPDTGDVRVFGRSTASIADADEWLAFADRIGIVSDRAVLLDAMTVLQNMAMPFSLEIEPPPPEVAAKAARLASMVSLPESVVNQRTAEVGPAMRVLVRFARALALDPGLLLLEHPTAGVSRQDIGMLADQVAATAARQTTALLIVTADEEFARRAAARVLRHDPGTGRLKPLRRGWF